MCSDKKFLNCYFIKFVMLKVFLNCSVFKCLYKNMYLIWTVFAISVLDNNHVDVYFCDVCSVDLYGGWIVNY